MKIVERFLNYVSIDTQSDPLSLTSPSTMKQWDLLRVLEKECISNGMEIAISEQGILYACLKGNPNKSKIGLIAHVDTSFDASGKNVRPRIVRYEGGDIELNSERTLSPSQFPTLLQHIGHELIVTDGTTLLGADDKAGIAIIMDVIEKLKQSSFDYGDVYVAFTSDEEIGAGTNHFDLSLFPVDYAYTIDGSDVRIVDYENFNAAALSLRIKGSSVHPGSAKGKMVSALLIGMEFEAMLPSFDKPQNTEGLEGFIHLVDMHGSVEKASMEYIIRHHDQEKFDTYKKTIEQIVLYLNQKYPHALEAKITDNYQNMKNYLMHDMTSVELAKAAMRKNGIDPVDGAIRGGTDGARLSAMGLLTPNLGTGGYLFHGPYEYLSINEMKKSVEIVMSIVELVKQTKTNT